MSDTTTPNPDAPIDESKENTLNTVVFKDVPDNTFTFILRINGKTYAIGGDIGKLSDDMHDEDLDSTLRALQGAATTIQRTLAVRGAGRPEDYPLPGDNPTIEENLAPKVSADAAGMLYIAGAKIEPGEAVHLDLDGKVYPLSKGAEDTKPEA